MPTLLWEYGKYSTIFLLFTGMVVENLKFLRINVLSLTYFICFLPSMALMPDVPFNHMRQMISGNLSGPLCFLLALFILDNGY